MKIKFEKLAHVSVLAVWLLAVFNPFFKKYDYGSELPLVLLLAISGLFMAVALWRCEREKARFEKVSLMIFMSLVILSFIFSSAKNVGFSEVMALLAVGNVYLILAYIKSDWEEKFLKVVAGAGFAAAVIGFVNYFLWDEVRMFGPFINKLDHAHLWPNAFGLFLVMVWPIALKYWKWRYKTAVLIVILSALLLTFSRGAMIVLAGQLLLLAVYFWREIPWKKVGIVGVFLPVIFFGSTQLRSLYYPIESLEEKVSFQGDEKNLSKSDRVTFWKGAVELALEKPLLGWGPFSFRYAYSLKEDNLLEVADHPHNVFLKVAAEYGFPALFSLLAFLAAVFLTGVKRFKNISGDKKDGVYLIFVALGGALAHNMIDYNFNFLATLMLFFILLACARTMLVERVEKIRSIAPLFFGIILSILACYEGSVQALNLTASEDHFLQYSLFPRSYKLTSAEGLISDGTNKEALKVLDDYESWNNIDGELYYLRARAYCDMGENEKCLNNLETAILYNGMNELRYYTLYLDHQSDAQKREEMLKKTLELIEIYFEYVKNNTHFSAYDDNVEAVSHLIKLIVDRQLVDEDEIEKLLKKRDEMLFDADHARDNQRL